MQLVWGTGSSGSLAKLSAPVHVYNVIIHRHMLFKLGVARVYFFTEALFQHVIVRILEVKRVVCYAIGLKLLLRHASVASMVATPLLLSVSKLY